MTAPDASVTSWPEKLEKALADLTHFNAVTVLEETASTQDATVRMGCAAGHVLTAGVQTMGRGRLGRSWLDRGGEGVAVTMVLPSDLSPRLSVAAAVSAAQAIQSFLSDSVRAQIRWPNDILVRGGKIAGILIEQDDALARLGIGINVAQEHFDAEIDQSVTSLRALGSMVDRCSVLEALLRAVDQNLNASDAELSAAFAEADALRGNICRFRVGGTEISGKVRSVDPFGRLVIEAGGEDGGDDGVVELDPRTTSLVHGPSMDE